MVLNEAYYILREAGLVSSESEFSEDWLGHSECYLRTLRFKKSDPSLGAIAICGSRLQKAGEALLPVPTYKKLGIRLLVLSERCHDTVNEGSVNSLVSTLSCNPTNY